MKKAALILIPLILLGATAAVLVIMQKNQDQKDRNVKTPDFKVIDNSSASKRTVIESEDFTEIEKPFSMITVADVPSGPVKSASKGKAVYLGPEKINESGDISKFKKGHPDAKHAGFVRYNLTPEDDGEYNLWLRVFWVDDCADSISVSLGNSPLLTMQSSDHGKWVWLPLRDGKGKPLSLTLAGGKTYPLTLCNREDDLFIDQIILQQPTAPAPSSIIKQK